MYFFIKKPPLFFPPIFSKSTDYMIGDFMNTPRETRVDAISPLPSGSPAEFEGFDTSGRLSSRGGSVTPGGTAADGFVTPIAVGFGDATPPATPLSPMRGFDVEPSDLAAAVTFDGFDEAMFKDDPMPELNGFDDGAELAL